MQQPIYYAAHEAEAGCIVSMLRDKGLQARWHEQNEVVQLPFTKQYVVVVSDQHMQTAQAIIEAARKNKIISLDGAFVSSSEGKV